MREAAFPQCATGLQGGPGNPLAVGTLLMAVVAPVAGRLADRYRAQVIAGCGVAVVMISPLIAMTLDERSSLLRVIALLAIQGLGFALFSSPNMKIAMNSVPPNRSSIASALSATSRSLGMLAGMFITGALISLTLGDAPVHQEPLRFLGPMEKAFLVLSMLTVVALAISLAPMQMERLRRH